MTRMLPRGVLLLAFFVCLAALVACSNTGGAYGTVKVALDDQSIKPDRASISPGNVTFEVSNRGKVGHELVVVQTDLTADKLPLLTADTEKHKKGDVDLTKVTSVGDVTDVAAGSSLTKIFALSKGKYVLICNIPAHYSSGMYTAFTVQ